MAITVQSPALASSIPKNLTSTSTSRRIPRKPKAICQNVTKLTSPPALSTSESTVGISSGRTSENLPVVASSSKRKESRLRTVG